MGIERDRTTYPDKTRDPDLWACDTRGDDSSEFGISTSKVPILAVCVGGRTVLSAVPAAVRGGSNTRTIVPRCRCRCRALWFVGRVGSRDRIEENRVLDAGQIHVEDSFPASFVDAVSRCLASGVQQAKEVAARRFRAEAVPEVGYLEPGFPVPTGFVTVTEFGMI